MEREFLPDLVNRVPEFAGLTLVEGWAGLYEMTPDHNPISASTRRSPASSSPTASADTG